MTETAGGNINDFGSTRWRSSGEDLSKLGSGRLKRSVIKCSDANVGSILVERQHPLQLNYLNTPVCEKQGRWGARRGRRNQVTPHLTTFISHCRQTSNVQSFARLCCCVVLKKKKEKNVTTSTLTDESLMNQGHHICMKEVNINEDIDF